MQLRPYQITALNDIHSAWANGHRNVLSVLPTGGGKCLGVGTPILLFDGTVKPVEDVMMGDFLMGPDSTPRMVLSTCSGSEMLYRVTPVKGDSYVVNKSHILSLKLTNFKGRLSSPDGKKWYSGALVNLPVTDYLKATNTFKHVAKGWRTGVDFQEYVKNESIITPYILGVWLGDGTSRRPEITNVDPEVLEEWKQYCESIGCRLIIKKTENRVDTHALISPWQNKRGRGEHSNPFLNELRNLNLIINKHIPHIFKTGSRKDRLELLAGILDTDGYMHQGSFDIVVKQEELAKDITFLARSLGFSCYLTACEKTCTNNGAIGQYWRMSISGDIDTIPCRVKRRKSPLRQQKKSVMVTGIKVEPIGVGNYYGFEIAGNDRLFLLGDFTVTHNTVIFSEAINLHNGASVAIAHRQELVGQMSLALARDGVRHRVIAPTPLIKAIVGMHTEELGRDYYNPSARCAVAGVDTIISWSKETSKQHVEMMRWANQVSLWVCDEAHHLLRSNKWGKATNLFPNAKGLGVTATPVRADGKGLGRHADGLFDCMVQGPGMRDLITSGYLTDYRIFCPPSTLDLANVGTGADGDYIRAKLGAETRKSSVMGDVVTHYLQWAKGKLGVTFAPDVETATMFSAAFNAAGVRAEVVCAKTPDRMRRDILKRFARREIHQLVNVDLFGEGFDLPAIEVVSMARATESYALHSQQFGRALRLLEGKQWAMIFDHVGNVARHGLPDRTRVWSLDRREKKSAPTDPNIIPIRTCLNPACLAPYEAIYPCCPFCGFVPVPTARSGPEFVDGDICELDAATLAALRGEIAQVDKEAGDILNMMQRAGHPYPVAKGNANRHLERQQAQTELRESIGWWAAFRQAAGDPDTISYRRFYHLFGTDVLSAQALGRAEAVLLTAKINSTIGR